MTQNRHPDIEIYIKDRSLDEIQAWLQQHCDQLTADSSKGLVHQFQAVMQGNATPIMVHEKVAGKAWTSVWFDSDKTAWPTDLDCARCAASELATQIRCIASGWQDGDDPDEWWKIENSHEQKIQWRTS